MRIPSGKTDQYVYFVAQLGGARVTGLSSFTVYRSRNGAAAAAFTTPTVNETDVTNMPGVYELLMDEDTTIASGSDSEEMALHITKTGMDPVTRTIELYRRTVTTGNTLAVDSGGTGAADVLEWLGTAAATPTTAGVPEVDVTHINGALTSGNNATLSLKQISVVNTTGSAIVATSSGSNGNGIFATGNGTGAGVRGAGGSTGNGFHGDGGVTSGSGFAGLASGVGHGFSGTGAAGGAGMFLLGQGTGTGLYASGGANGDGIIGKGQGIGAGIAGKGGDTFGPGIFADGADFDGGNTQGGPGFQALGGMNKSGVEISIQSGNADGIYVRGQGTGSGVAIQAGATGEGIEIVGGTTSGKGLTITTTNGTGIEVVAGGSGTGMELSSGPTAWAALAINGWGTAHGAAFWAENGGDGLLSYSDGAGKGINAAEIDAIDNFLDTEVAAIKAKTDSLTFTVAGQVDANVLDWKSATAPAMTGDAFARLGAPAGASVSADIAALPAIVDLADEADIADAVWDEALAGHVTAGSTGKNLGSLTFTVAGQADVNIQSVNDVTVNGVGTAGNPWGP